MLGRRTELKDSGSKDIETETPLEIL